MNKTIEVKIKKNIFNILLLILFNPLFLLMFLLVGTYKKENKIIYLGLFNFWKNFKKVGVNE